MRVVEAGLSKGESPASVFALAQRVPQFAQQYEQCVVCAYVCDVGPQEKDSTVCDLFLRYLLSEGLFGRFMGSIMSLAIPKYYERRHLDEEFLDYLGFQLSSATFLSRMQETRGAEETQRMESLLAEANAAVQTRQCKTFLAKYLVGANFSNLLAVLEALLERSDATILMKQILAQPSRPGISSNILCRMFASYLLEVPSAVEIIRETLVGRHGMAHAEALRKALAASPLANALLCYKTLAAVTVPSSEWSEFTPAKVAQLHRLLKWLETLRNDPLGELCILGIAQAASRSESDFEHLRLWVLWQTMSPSSELNSSFTLKLFPENEHLRALSSAAFSLLDGSYSDMEQHVLKCIESIAAALENDVFSYLWTHGQHGNAKHIALKLQQRLPALKGEVEKSIFFCTPGNREFFTDLQPITETTPLGRADIARMARLLEQLFFKGLVNRFLLAYVSQLLCVGPLEKFKLLCKEESLQAFARAVLKSKTQRFLFEVIQATSCQLQRCYAYGAPIVDYYYIKMLLVIQTQKEAPLLGLSFLRPPAYDDSCLTAVLPERNPKPRAEPAPQMQCQVVQQELSCRDASPRVLKMYQEEEPDFKDLESFKKPEDPVDQNSQENSEEYHVETVQLMARDGFVEQCDPTTYNAENLAQKVATLYNPRPFRYSQALYAQIDGPRESIQCANDLFCLAELAEDQPGEFQLQLGSLSGSLPMLRHVEYEERPFNVIKFSLEIRSSIDACQHCRGLSERDTVENDDREEERTVFEDIVPLRKTQNIQCREFGRICAKCAGQAVQFKELHPGTLQHESVSAAALVILYQRYYEPLLPPAALEILPPGVKLMARFEQQQRQLLQFYAGRFSSCPTVSYILRSARLYDHGHLLNTSRYSLRDVRRLVDFETSADPKLLGVFVERFGGYSVHSASLFQLQTHVLGPCGSCEEKSRQCPSCRRGFGLKKHVLCCRRCQLQFHAKCVSNGLCGTCIDAEVE